MAHIHVIHHIPTYTYIFISSAFCGRLAALDPLCPIQLVLPEITEKYIRYLFENITTWL
jgi:hypothetical protein